MIGWMFLGAILILGGALLAIQPAAATGMANALRFLPAEPTHRQTQCRIAGAVILALGAAAVIIGLTR
jgi:uncharacterized protein YjeT (DUF2065 family)